MGREGLVSGVSLERAILAAECLLERRGSRFKEALVAFYGFRCI